MLCYEACSLVAGADDERWLLNTGLLLVRRSNATDHLLAALARKYDEPAARHAINPEQAALVDMYRAQPRVRRAVCVAPRRPWLQSFVKYGEFRRGDFAAHFPLASRQQLGAFLRVWRKAANRTQPHE